MPRHPAEDLGRRRDRSELRERARTVARVLRREARKDVAERRRRDERTEQMTAAPFVFLRRARAVLVRADRDVLRAVIRRELRAAHRNHRRRERQHAREQLLRRGTQLSRLANALHDNRDAGHRSEHARALHRHQRTGKLPLHLRQERERLGEPCRPAQQRARHARRPKALARGRDFELPVRVANRARPRIRAVDEHAVRERHTAEPDLFLAHRSRG